MCGNLIESTFGVEDKFYQELATACWASVVALHYAHIEMTKVGVYSDEVVQGLAQKLKQYDSSFVLPEIKATEKRDYTIKGILIVAGILIIGFLWFVWAWS